MQVFPSFGQNQELLPNNLADTLEYAKKTLPNNQKSLLKVEKALFADDSLAQGLKSLPSMLTDIPSDTIKSDTSSVSQPKSDIDFIIDYSSRDSIFFDVKNQKMYLYGDAKIKYGNMNLAAERIDLDWKENTVEANYVLDSVGKKIGKPVYTEKNDTYVTNNMVYNLNSKKALIRGVITEQDGAFMHGEKVKKNEFDELYIKDAKYTTCNLEDPHFYIKSKKLKVVPNKKTITGPFNIYFGEIPMPIGFLFGMFPQPKTKASGIIVPTYGEDPVRGFFIRNGGYYFAISDHIDMKLTGELYSGGSYGLNMATRYKTRYHYSGSFNLSYNKSVSSLLDNETFSKDFAIRWSHTPQSKGTGRFSASVNAMTNSFNQNVNQVSRSFTQSINAQFTSNISYSKVFKGTPFNMTLNMRQSQNIQTGLASVSLPELALNATRLFPFKRFTKSSKSIFSKLGFSYSMSAKNEISNKAVQRSNFEVLNRGSLDDSLVAFSADNINILFDRARNGIRHSIPISTSFSMLKFLTVSPSFNYTELWYPKELKYTYLPEQEGVRVDTLRGFSRTGFWNTGASMNTRVYGTYFFPGKRIQAIRHVITPSIGFSYRPDFGDDKYGNFQTVQINENGDTRTLSKFEGFAYGGASRGGSSSLTFSVTNNIEMKVKTKNDTVNEYKKVKLFDNLSFGSSYNLAADSFKLSDIRMSARTTLFKNALSLNFTGAMDPYSYILDSISISSTGAERVHQRKIDKFAWNNGNGLGGLKNATITVGLNFKGKSKATGNTSSRGGLGGDRGQQQDDAFNNFGDDNQDENQQQQQNQAYNSLDPNLYVDFDIPWALRVNYSYNYRKTGFAESNISQVLNFSGNVSITQKTKIGFNSGYDLENNEFTVTRLNLTRDLHCWALNFNWVPFGPRQEYFVEIRVLSSLLSDLKIDKKRRSASAFGNFGR